MTKAILILFFALILSAGITSLCDDAKTEINTADTTIESIAISESAEIKIQYFAYYFYGDRRCVTCKKLEAYASEAFTGAFEKELADSVLVWTPINFDREENKHFIDDYELYTKALVLSRVENGKEVVFKNLDQIWLRVSDKEDYIDYVQSQTRQFMDAVTEQDNK